MDWSGFLDFLALAERLKCATRHCTNSQGDPESVAEHSWRAALMALCLEQELPGVEMDRVIRMLLIHDLGEAVTGDIPTFRKSKQDEAVRTRRWRTFSPPCRWPPARSLPACLPR